MSAAAIILKSVVFAVRCIIRMSGARKPEIFAVIAASRVLVRYDYRNGSARGLPLENTACYYIFVFFTSRSRYSSRGTAESESMSYRLLVHVYSGGKSVENRSYIRSVALTENGEADRCSECVFHLFPSEENIFSARARISGTESFSIT